MGPFDRRNPNATPQTTLGWAGAGAAFGFLVGLGVSLKFGFDPVAVNVFWPLMTLSAAVSAAWVHWRLDPEAD